MDVIPQETEVKKKRGRPKGSKNKPKSVAEGSNGNEGAIDPVIVVDQEVSAGKSIKKPAKKRAKKAATDDVADVEPVPKKRAKTMPKAIAPRPSTSGIGLLAGGPDADLLAKMDRVMRQRMFLLEQSEITDIHRNYGVIGSTGNVYTVQIKQAPQCNCPDWTFRRNTCKHILFIVLKVLKVNLQDPLSWQRSYSEMELERIFANAPQNPIDRITQQLQEQYQQLNKAAPSSEPEPEPKANAEDDAVRRPIEGDCPICFDEMTTKQQTVWCKASCHNNLHKVCFEKWSAANYGVTTCVYCRAEWIDDGHPKPKPKKAKKATGFRVDPTKGDAGYQNLGHLVGAPAKRDYSIERALKRAFPDL